jgi:hypothetical protein
MATTVKVVKLPVTQKNLEMSVQSGMRMLSSQKPGSSQFMNLPSSVFDLYHPGPRWLLKFHSSHFCFMQQMREDKKCVPTLCKETLELT